MASLSVRSEDYRFNSRASGPSDHVQGSPALAVPKNHNKGFSFADVVNHDLISDNAGRLSENAPISGEKGNRYIVLAGVSLAEPVRASGVAGNDLDFIFDPCYDLVKLGAEKTVIVEIPATCYNDSCHFF